MIWHRSALEMLTTSKNTVWLLGAWDSNHWAGQCQLPFPSSSSLEAITPKVAVAHLQRNMATGERQDLRLISTCSRLPLLGGGQDGVALKSLKMTAGNMGLTNPFVGTASSDGTWDLPFQLVTTLPDCLLIWIINSHEIAPIINKNICYSPPKRKTGGTMVKNPPARAGDAGDTGSISGSRRTPCRRAWQSTPVHLPEKYPFGDLSSIGILQKSL